MCQERKAAPVGETDEEDCAQRDPHPPRVQHLAAEGADPTARHVPRNLRACPRLGDPAVVVLDLAEGDLARLARPDPDRPPAGRLVEGRVGLRLRGIAGDPAGDLRVVEKPADDDVLRQTRRSGRRSERLLDEAALAARGERNRGARGPGRRGMRRERKRERTQPRARVASSPPERPELVADEVERRHEHDGERLRRYLPHPGRHDEVEHRRGSREATPSRRRGSAIPGRRRCPARP